MLPQYFPSGPYKLTTDLFLPVEPINAAFPMQKASINCLSPLTEINLWISSVWEKNLCKTSSVIFDKSRTRRVCGWLSVKPISVYNHQGFEGRLGGPLFVLDSSVTYIFRKGFNCDPQNIMGRRGLWSFWKPIGIHTTLKKLKEQLACISHHLL